MNQQLNGKSCSTESGAVDEPLSRIEGLDFTEGLYLAAGNRELYAAILSAFLTNNSDVVERVREACAVDDIVTATRLVHSLKGAAGTIGAIRLQETSRAAERALSDGEERVAEAEIQDIERLIAPLLSQLREALV
ncbi:Hpt domain-containing protein [Pontiella sp. NLcol2]|uniref:Hpt domain-containing protein n=2 Tax=Pontiella agarivorans TaxID=3038953 RepID=A0ABU5MX25_9BACT|nr:Hpt domain-containing protein [Pontiella agarivorans]